MEFSDELYALYEDETEPEPEIIPEPEKESPGFFGSVKRGIDQVEASLYGAAGLAGGALEKTVGVGEDLQQWGIEGYLRNIEEAEEHAATVTFKEAREDLSKLPTWMIEQLGGVLPSMAEAAAGALVGTFAAGPLGTTVGAFAGRTVLKKAIKKGIKETIENKFKGKVLSKAAKEVVEKQVAAATFRNFAAKAGMGAAVFPMEAGGNYAELLTEHGVDSPTWAIGTGLAATSLEFAFGGGHMRLIDKWLPKGTNTALQKALKAGDTNFVKRAAKEMLKQAPQEALQEAGQEFLSALNIVANTDEKLFTGETAERMLESGAVGALAGGFGGGISAIKSGGNVSKEDMYLAKKVESTPGIKDKDVLFEDLVKRTNKTGKPSFAEIDAALEEALEVGDAESMSAGMTSDQVDSQEEGKAEAVQKDEELQEKKVAQAVGMKEGKEDAQAKVKEQEAAKEQDTKLKEDELFEARLKVISTPEGLKEVTKNTLADMEAENDGRPIVKALRTVYKDLHEDVDNLKKLESDLTDLEISKVNIEDRYELAIADRLEAALAVRIKAVAKAEADKEEAKRKEAPAVQATTEEVRPTVVKTRQAADVKKGEEVTKRAVKAAAAAPIIEVTPKKTPTEITKENLEKQKVGAKRTIAAQQKAAPVVKVPKAKPTKKTIVPVKKVTKAEAKKIEVAKTAATLKKNKKEAAQARIDAGKAARKGMFKYSEASPAELETKGKPVSVAEREIHRANMEAGLEGYVGHLENVGKINVVKNEKDAPAAIRDKVTADKKSGKLTATPYAMFDHASKEIYVFSDAVRTADEAKYEAWHELGHYSFEQIHGKEGTRILEGIKKKFPQEVLAKGGVAEEVLIEKFLANDKSTLITRARHLFSKLADKLSGEKKITDHDINRLIKRMRKNLATAEKPIVEPKKGVVTTKEITPFGDLKYSTDRETILSKDQDKMNLKDVTNEVAKKENIWMEPVKQWSEEKQDVITVGERPLVFHHRSKSDTPRYQKSKALKDKGEDIVWVAPNDSPLAMYGHRKYKFLIRGKHKVVIGLPYGGSEIPAYAVPVKQTILIEVDGKPVESNLKYSAVKPTATFLGWQEVPNKPSIALYNIVGGKRHGSTVSAPTLKEEGIAVPKTPKQVTAKQIKALKKPIFYSQQFEVEETGETVTVKIDAVEALSQIDNDLFSLKVLRDCI